MSDIEYQKINIEEKKIDLEERRLALEAESGAKQSVIGWFSVVASVVAAFVGAGSLTFSILAERAASRADTQASAAKQAIEEIQTNTQLGVAKIDLLRLGVSHLERMVDPNLEPYERDRSCFVAARLAIVEDENFQRSRHILSLHGQYIRNYSGGETVPTAEGRFNDMCSSLVGELQSAPVDQALNKVVPRRVPSTFAPPTETSALASNVVVLASYRSGNCKIAKSALMALQPKFEETLTVALSRSKHYTVVYSPTETSTPINLFFHKARSMGASARERIGTSEEENIDKPNLQYVADAYIANTNDWSLLPESGCPQR